MGFVSRRNCWRLGAIFLSICMTLIAMGLSFVASRGNHCSYDIRPAMLGGIVSVAYGVLGFRFGNTKRLSMLLCVLGGLVVVIIVVFDRFNLLVQHTIWCDRGMPAPWTPQF